MQPESRSIPLVVLVLFVLLFMTGCASGTTVQGRVFSGEAPLSSVTVQLKIDGESVETQTADDGSFEFDKVGAGARILSVRTTIDGQDCTVTRTLQESEGGRSIDADLRLPTQLKPPDVVMVGGVGYVAGDLNIVC